jgi:hypothetical protein
MGKINKEVKARGVTRELITINNIVDPLDWSLRSAELRLA